MSTGSIAIIPARGGSKRIPRKNIRNFCGKPIIVYSIETATASKCFERIIVSTDDEEIAETARQAGAEVPFVRPAKLADDYATTIEVVSHAVNWMAERGQMPESACCIYPTAPFLRADDLKRGAKTLNEIQCDYVVSVTSYAYPIQRALRITPAGLMAMFQPETCQIRSQDLEKAYHDAGQFYWGRGRAWQESRPILGPDSAPLVLHRFLVQDIDEPEDWALAEDLFHLNSRKP